jgi:MYXO-CTERM domain-containing protein
MAGREDYGAKEKEQMTFLKTATTSVFCLALMGAVFSPAAKADEWNRKTKITFSGPVEIPGVHLKGWGVLPAGTYVFKIVDSLSDRHIVQIFNADETQVYATILAIPNYRLKATDKTVITFRERPAGQPEALRAWFYPGRNWGEEFVYPKAKAIELAKVTNTPVLYTVADLPLEVEQPTAAVYEPVVVQLRQAPIRAIQPTGDDVEIAAVVTPPPAAELEPTQMAMTRLPETASPLPLIALLGLLALGGAFGLRLYQKRGL